jgi:uncharacterized membrane protein
MDMAATPFEKKPQRVKPVLDPLRHYEHYQKDDSPFAGGSSFMERVAEGVASGMGTVAFIIISSLLILAWVFANGAVHYISSAITNIGNGKQFDPEPWILLNLIFSAVAFYTGALVIIAQKAQTRTDKANEEAAAMHRDEIAQFQTDLLQQNTDLTTQIHALAEQLESLTEQVHAVTCGRSPIVEVMARAMPWLWRRGSEHVVVRRDPVNGGLDHTSLQAAADRLNPPAG